VSQDKVRKGTTNELMIPIHPALARALKAGPVVGMQNLITDARGRPLRGLTELIDRAVRAAGLPRIAWRMDCARLRYGVSRSTGQQPRKLLRYRDIAPCRRSSATHGKPIRPVLHNPQLQNYPMRTNRDLLTLARLVTVN